MTARIELLQAMPVFGGLRGDALAFLPEPASTVTVAADAFFFRQDEPAQSMFVLEAGTGAVVKSWRGHQYLLSRSPRAIALAKWRAWTCGLAAPRWWPCSHERGAMKRIADEPAFVLHRYDWSESSLILEVFTRHYGRIALVAKGAKKPSSNFRPVLLPLQPLHVAFGGDAEIRTLKSAEWLGGHVMPTGDPLLSGYYLNELLLRLLARDDPHPVLFDAYANTARVLASDDIHTLQPALRAFELLLLREIGLLPVLDLQTGTLAALKPGQRYSLRAEGGLVEAFEDDERGSLAGSQWLALQAALDSTAPFADTLREAAAAIELKPQLRALLHYHCGVSTLRTRQLMLDLQAL